MPRIRRSMMAVVGSYLRLLRLLAAGWCREHIRAPLLLLLARALALAVLGVLAAALALAASPGVLSIEAGELGVEERQLAPELLI